MNIREYLKENIVILDGGMGTILQNDGLLPGEYPERWNITNADKIIKIHKEYYDAGSNIVNTNTFGANILKFSSDELEKIIKAAVENAKAARKLSSGEQEKFIALDIGPTGKLLKPYGDLDFEEAVEIFAKTIRIGSSIGVDLIYIETMNDSYETKAAILAAKENSTLPIFVSNAYGEDKKLMTGASPSAMVTMLEGMGADAIGVNCSLGPKDLEGVVDELLKYSSTPVILKPNAGLPKNKNGKVAFDVLPEEFSEDIKKAVEKGVRIVGGCCGTTPQYIRAVCEKIKALKPLEIKEKNITSVSSYTHMVEFKNSPVLIGERINPTGKKLLKEALKNNDIDYILSEGIKEQEAGCHILDVNVGLPEIDEPKMLERAVCELQAIINLPLQIDTSDYVAMDRALRRYNGKAMINSVNGKKESMEKIFPLVKKYGGLVVALTLDESGIPNSIEGRVEIAKNIIKTAEAYGVKKKDLIFDTLAMTVSADKNAAMTTLGALNYIKNELGCHTSLGVSNVSFGLPSRDAINATFFALSLENGLSAAIMNPFSTDMMKTYYSFCALHGLDDNCIQYIEYFNNLVEVRKEVASTVKNITENEYKSELQRAIVKGLKERAGEITEDLLKSVNPLEIVEKEVIPALDIVGVGFEKKTFYLPQLLMSAEAAKASFEKIKKFMSDNKTKMSEKCPVVIATVKGDIHDIGKNIVKLLLQNYGFGVCDLGKDVEPQLIVDEAIKKRAPIVALSALMTTTVPAMEETIKLLREKVPGCKVIVGGAVLTKEYADLIGADKYAKDAMEGVRYAEEVFSEMSE